MSYAPPPPPPGVSASQPLRGRTPLRLAVIFLVLGLAGIIVGAVIGVKGGLSKVDGFTRIKIGTDASAASSGKVTFGTGGYIAYYEADGVDVKEVPLSGVRLTSPSGKQTILTKLYGGEDITKNPTGTHKLGGLTYNYNGHHGVAEWQFNISEQGTYTVEVEGAPNAASDAQMAFGRSIGKSTAVGGVLILVGVLLLIAGIVLLIVGLVKRRHSKKERAAAQNYYGQSGGYGAGPQGGYPPQPPGGYGQQPGYAPGYSQQPGGYPPPPGGYPPPAQQSGYQPPTYGSPQQPPPSQPPSLEKNDGDQPWPPRNDGS